jgi:RimJ/RimL family protein N-acetyltransferase
VERALETERLLLEPWSHAATELLVRLSADPRVMRHIGDGRCRPAGEARAAGARMTRHWHEHGFGWRAAVEKATRAHVGLVALSYAQPGTAGVATDDVELGWWLAPEAWGRGLATEGGLAVRDDAFERLGVASLVARLQPANAASARVAARLGMAHELDTTGAAGEAVAVYRLRRDEWERARSSG